MVMTTGDITLVSDVVRRSSVTWPGRISVQNADGSIRLTYAELWHEVERGAAALRSMGLLSGDRVLLAVDSSPAWIVSFLAISHAGLVAVPVPHTTSATLVRLVALHAHIRVGIANRANGWLESAIMGLKFIAPADLGSSACSPGSADPGIHAGIRHAGSKDPALQLAVLVFTSGSTTRPRAVALSHAALRANLRALQALRSPEPGETVLSTLPPSHAYELVAGQLAPLAAGARIVYAGALLPNRLIDTIRTQAVTRMMLVPALLDLLVRDVIDRITPVGPGGAAGSEFRALTAQGLADLIHAMSSAERDRLRDAIRAEIGHAFVVATLGGAASDPAWTAVLDAAGVKLDVGYGLTEAGPVVTMGRASDCPAGSVGRALPGVEIRIADDGEILVRSQSIMEGYAGDADATAAALVEGWLQTGDRGRLDADGFLFIQGRIKEAMVTSAGETIYPDEIEPAYGSPLFTDVAIVSMPDDRGNDVPTLVVVPASTPHAKHVDAIRAEVGRLRAAAPARLRVQRFVLRSELPRSAAGKIRRRALADELRPHEVLQ
jgi:long-chain acyl-CoA synthetase